jgi:hypothetical protein
MKKFTLEDEGLPKIVRTVSLIATNSTKFSCLELNFFLKFTFNINKIDFKNSKDIIRTGHIELFRVLYETLPHKMLGLVCGVCIKNQIGYNS